MRHQDATYTERYEDESSEFAQTITRCAACGKERSIWRGRKCTPIIERHKNGLTYACDLLEDEKGSLEGFMSLLNLKAKFYKQSKPARYVEGVEIWHKDANFFGDNPKERAI